MSTLHPFPLVSWSWMVIHYNRMDSTILEGIKTIIDPILRFRGGPDNTGQQEKSSSLAWRPGFESEGRRVPVSCPVKPAWLLGLSNTQAIATTLTPQEARMRLWRNAWGYFSKYIHTWNDSTKKHIIVFLNYLKETGKPPKFQSQWMKWCSKHLFLAHANGFARPWQQS